MSPIVNRMRKQSIDDGTLKTLTFWGYTEADGTWRRWGVFRDDFWSVRMICHSLIVQIFTENLPCAEHGSRGSISNWRKWIEISASRYSILVEETDNIESKTKIHICKACTCSAISNSLPSMDCSLLGFSVLGIFQARVLEWIATYYSRRASQPREQTHVSCIGRQIL